MKEHIMLILHGQETKESLLKSILGGRGNCELSHSNNNSTWPWAAMAQFSCYLIRCSEATSMQLLSINNSGVEN